MYKLLSETTTRVVMPKDLNSYGTLFGGNLIAWMDELAVIFAMKITGKECVTLYFDKIEFKRSVTTNDIIILKATLTEVGLCHLTINVKAFKTEHLNITDYIGQGTAKFVALDANKKPVKIKNSVINHIKSATE